jgi:hypothetical protein
MTHLYDLIDAAIYLLPVAITLATFSVFGVRAIRHA